MRLPGRVAIRHHKYQPTSGEYTMKQLTNASNKYSDMQRLNIRHDRDYQAVWAEMSFTGRPCMNMVMLNDLAGAQDEIAALCRKNNNTGAGNELQYRRARSRRSISTGTKWRSSVPS